jgi:ubiquinone/menaquinone biosynthesis C-methylase UbiE
MNKSTTKFGVPEQVEKEFRDYLYTQMQKQGYSQSRQIFWAEYMLDTSRPEKIIADFFTDLNLKSDRREAALDIGCGFGSLIVAMQPYFQKVCGIDINTTYVEWAKKRAIDSEVMYGNAKELPYEDSSFDLVCATDMFEHIDYEEQKIVATEVMRVLKPGGYGIVIVPNRFQLLDEHNKVWFGTWLPPSKRENYVRMFSQHSYYDRCWERTGKDWKKLFELKGFKVNISSRYLKDLNFLKYSPIPPNRYKLYLQKTSAN